MGTISERIRKNGTKAYTAQIRIKRDGTIVHSEAQTFDRRPVAAAWLRKREGELDQPGALEKLKTDVTLDKAIGQYVDTSVKSIGRTKAQCLSLLRRHPLAQKKCSGVSSVDLCSLASDLLDGWRPDDLEVDDLADDGEKSIRQPQTVANYMSHLGAVFAIARPMWGYQLDKAAFDDAYKVLRRMGVISKSRERDRRPTIDQLDRLMAYFTERKNRAAQSMPMDKVILFGIFSTRRQEEITRLRWADYEPQHERIMVRDMKHPGQKKGNDVWCSLTPEAMAIIEGMPRKTEEIFPYNSGTISSNFTKACSLLDIDDLHFHDLRHDGISRLFEMGWNIPNVASVSAHRSWSSLKRYTHIRQVGDKYAGWKWMPSASPTKGKTSD